MANTSDADIAGFVDKLAVFRESLTATEQGIFDVTLTAALSTAADEVQGFEMDLSGIQPQLMATLLSNIANMRHEALRSIANNLRA